MMFSKMTRLSILRALVTKKTPFYIQFFINSACNLRCKQCNIAAANTGLRDSALDEIAIMAENIKKIGGGIVLLTGGEPFLRQDIAQVAKIFINQNIDIRLQTAGMATAEQLQACYKNGVRNINVSLDSLNADKQDYINSLVGSWHKALETIELISRIFNKDSELCALGCVLSRFNYQEIPALLEFATRIGWYLSLVPVHIASPHEYYSFRSHDQHFCFTSHNLPKLETIIKRILQMKRQGYLLFDSERFLQSAFNFISTGIPSWRHHGLCDAPLLYFAIRPNGDFAVCCDQILPRSYSLTDPNFFKYYKRGDLYRLTRPVVQNCPGCHYGSYPEISLSVRDQKAMLEKAGIVLLRKKQCLTKLEPGRIFSIVEEVQAKYPEVYQKNVEDEDLQSLLTEWKNSQHKNKLSS